MATISSVEYALAVPTTPPSSSNRPNKQHGRWRVATATLVSDGVLINGVASTAGVDTFNLFVLPVGARILQILLYYSGTPGATHTLSIGVVGAVAQYRTAAVLPAAAASPALVFIPAATLASATAGVGNSELAAATLIQATSAAAVMPAGTCVISLAYAVD